MREQRKKYILALFIVTGCAVLGVGYGLWAPSFLERGEDGGSIASGSGDTLSPNPASDGVMHPSPSLEKASSPASAQDAYYGDEAVVLYGGSDSSSTDVFPAPTSKTPNTAQSYIIPSPSIPKKTLTEEEIFSLLWPVSYQDFILTTQQMMVQDGVQASFSSQHVSTDAEVYDALEEILDYAAFKRWVKEGDVENFRSGIRDELPKLIAEERQALRDHGTFSSGIIPGGQRLVFMPKEKESLISTLLDGLRYVFSVRVANAGWVTGGDCYKDDSPDYPIPGFNSWVFCCNCGLECTPAGCTHVSDCGPHSVACDVPLGCLNLICKSWPNAIWDSQTGICGCG